MKKGVIEIFFVFVILISGIVIASNHTNVSDDKKKVVDSVDKVEKGYQCLEDLVKEKEGIALQEAIFGSLALGSNSKLKEAIEKEKRDSDACWPRSGCSVQDSAQVLLAYDKISGNKEEIKKWLLSKSISAKDLVWYLEIDIDSHEISECKLKYGSYDLKIKVKEDMTLEGNAGSCLDISYGGYWFKINEKCLDTEFEISCDKDFVTTLVYQRKEGENVYVSSNTHSGTSLGATNERVNAKCFTTGAKCDYEDSLWAALALSKVGEDVSAYLPYLVALSSDNQKYLPSAFLYILIGSNDQYGELANKQKNGQYWDVVGSSYNRFYDTSLAMLALAGTGLSEFDSAQNYLLSIQTKDGCWNNNNLRDSAFILYSGWPKVRGGNGGDDGKKLCESEGYYCEGNDACLNAEGNVLSEFRCTNFREICCSVKVVEPTCEEKKGVICTANQECNNGRMEFTSDGRCCVGGGCINKKVENVCEIAGGSCKSSCSDSEKKSDESCPDERDICCSEKEKPKTSEKVGSYLWIIILSILIVLVIIALIYRRKIRIWWYSRKAGRGAPQQSGAGPSGRPPGFMPLQPQMKPMMSRYGPPGQRGHVRGGPALRMTKGVKSQEEKDMEETMRKLKEMSK